MYLENDVDINTEIELLKGKTITIQKSVDGVKVAVSDLAEQTEGRFEVTGTAIEMEVKRATDAEDYLSSQIEFTAESFEGIS